MTEQNNQRPKARLHQTIRNISASRQHFGLSLNAVEYLRHIAECVSPDDLKDGRTPWCYERVDDLAHRLAIDPRSVQNIEKRLHDLNLIERKPMNNGHRCGKRCRRTGELLWVHGISLAPLIERDDEIAAIEQTRADRDRAYRRMRQNIHAVRARLKETLAAAQPFASLAALRDQTWAIYDASPSRVTRQGFGLDDLTRLHAELTLALDALATALDAITAPEPKAVDNLAKAVKISDAPEISCRQKYSTTPVRLYSCNDAEPPDGGTFSDSEDRANARSGLEMKGASVQVARKPEHRAGGKKSDPVITPERLLDLAPERWRDAISGIDRPDWTVIGFVAAARRAELGVSETAWRTGVERMGARRAALCLAILDTNRNHPTKPVRSVGGAFVAMTRRDAKGELDLAPSIRWIAARRAGADGTAGYHGGA